MRCAHDFPGIEELSRIEQIFHVLESSYQAHPEHLFVEFRANDAVAMLAGMRALVGTHQCEGLFGNRTHCLQVFVQFEIQYRADMQTAHRCMRIPGALCPVFFEHLRQSVGIFGEMF